MPSHYQGNEIKKVTKKKSQQVNKTGASAVRVSRDVYCCLYVVYLGRDKGDIGKELERGSRGIM